MVFERIIELDLETFHIFSLEELETVFPKPLSIKNMLNNLFMFELSFILLDFDST